MTVSQIEQSAELQPAMSAPVLRTLAVCDLVESTALVARLGDQRAAEFMRRHDRLARDLLHRHSGREIDKTDGFLFLFERPIHAIACALDYQRLLRQLGETERLPLSARIGIHVGDVVLWENDPADIAHGAKPLDVEGMVKPVAARLMGIAQPGQILLSGITYTLAHRAQSELGENYAVRWRSHGSYRFKGVLDFVQVYEVGEQSAALLKAPAWSGKAHREVPWWRRPAALAIEAAALAFAIAVPVYFSLRSPAAIAFAERDWVVVGDLKNQTGQNLLDDSLDTAFRVSMEQSRYVNLVPTLQVRDALKRMQQPVDTRVDRVVGSEIALREGARALILPSVAEVGGRVRVTAEVIDPHTQRTVYAETADGLGMESVLPSVGRIATQLRERLGETLAAVDASNAPLPRVTTANLDALRAYALAVGAEHQERDADALALYRHALDLDPKFALAEMGIARVYVNNDDDAHAIEYVRKAAVLKDRLPNRDQLYVDAWLARFGPPGPMLEKWKLLGQLYPDYYAAHANYAEFAWQYENRYAAAIAAIQPALSEHYPYRASSYYTLASLQTADEQFAPAIENFRLAGSLGDSAHGIFYAAAYAAQRRFDEAWQLLDKSKPAGIPTEDIFLPQEKFAVDADQGRYDQARSLAASAALEAAKVGPLYERTFRAMQLSLDGYSAAKKPQVMALRKFVDDSRDAMQQPTPTNHDDAVFEVLFGAYLAAQAGDAALAQTALTAATPQARGSGFPNLEHLLTIVEAELSRREGQANAAVALLEPTRDGTELYLTHVALADAYTDAGRAEDALKEAQWLAQHRGRAYLESNSFQFLQARNVIESNLALLREAELEHALAHDDKARASLAAFNAAWPEADKLAWLVPRLKALRQVLDAASSV